VHFNPDVTKYIPWIACYEGDGDLSAKHAEKCAEQFNIDFPNIEDCTTGQLGESLDMTNAKLTLAYKGPWMGTPTITVNGKATQQDVMDKAICNAYTGKRPVACSDSSAFSSV